MTSYLSIAKHVLYKFQYFMTNIGLVIGKEMIRKKKLKCEREVQRVMKEKHLTTKGSVTPRIWQKVTENW